jgi:O-antigen ligase
MGEILIALAILAGRTRSVIIGAAAALLLLALRIPFARSSGRTARAAAGAVLLVAFAAGAAIWHFRSSPTVSGVPLLSRLTHYSPGDDPSTRNRMLSWRAALRAFADAPVLGIGHDNVYYALNRYYDPRRIQFTYNFRDRSESRNAPSSRGRRGR